MDLNLTLAISDERYMQTTLLRVLRNYGFASTCYRSNSVKYFRLLRAGLSAGLIALLTLPVASANDLAKPSMPHSETGGISNPSSIVKKLKSIIAEELPGNETLWNGKTPKKYPLESRIISKHQSYDFEQDIRPIFDTKCIACHACYDAPCQLKLETGGRGLERGASKVTVYDGGRLRNIPPTRLGVDGQTPEDWRNQGFYDVLIGKSNNASKARKSSMENMLDLGRNGFLRPNQRIPKNINLDFNRTLVCPAPDEFPDYAESKPHGGMPLAVSGLDDAEYQTLSTWIREGALINKAAVTLTAEQRLMIDKAEVWFNRPDARVRLVSRYLFEHLFLANLYFDPPKMDHPVQYFRLIRSKTPPGTPAVPVQTVRPNDDPETDFYYRLIPIAETIMHKGLIAYRFDESRLAFYDELFLHPGWSIDKLPGYRADEKANPFLVFSAIPPESRYRFLLTDAEFFVRNFIRGPVCHGQIATSVIRDQFWVMFENPATERFVNDPNYGRSVTSLLGVPGQNSSLTKFGPEWLGYLQDRNDYLEKRQLAYRTHYPKGAEENHVWDGDDTNTNAFLTVFRHHSNASVVRGWQGTVPLTAWLFDYPLFERTFYELVVGFDVFGSVSHQTQTRLYFDLIRNEAETNFLRLLPSESRLWIYDQWYQGAGKLKAKVIYQSLDTDTPSAIQLNPDDPKKALLQKFLNSHPRVLPNDDIINRCTKDCAQSISNENHKVAINALRHLGARTAEQSPGIKWMPEVSFLRIDIPGGGYSTYSILRNRRHTNVAFILGESLRYQENLDTLTILPYPVGSYPNLMFRVNLNDVVQFSETLMSVNSEDAFDQIIDRWGVLRMSSKFWETLHSFSEQTQRSAPLEAGIYDISRYGHW